jgi:lysophospholipase L1-like esterase
MIPERRVQAMKKDYRSDPVRKLLLLGESNGFGMCAGDPRNEWIQTLAGLIRDFQDEPLFARNNSIPGSVIGPSSPGYRFLPDGALPSALERYEREIVGPGPDMAVISYGLNDSRCGNPVERFIADLETIVSGVRARTGALVVITSPYWNTQYNEELWKRHLPWWADDPAWRVFTLTGDDLVLKYVSEMRALAEKHSCIFVDLYSLTENCHWLLNDDQVHFNDVGHRVIGQAVFNAVAQNCSFVGRRSMRLAKEGNLDITNTGGTQCSSRMIQFWLGR